VYGIGHPIVHAVVHVKNQRTRVFGLLRGRMVRKEGRPVLAEIDVLDMSWQHTGRTTLVPVLDVDPVTSSARAQMADLGHQQFCVCKGCIDDRTKP
jgi:hypothetical protein